MPIDLTVPIWVLALAAGLFGVCFGSFANVAGWRLPRGESILKPPSHCPRCGHRLQGPELLPVLGWFIVKGRCRYCKEKVSFRYPAMEALCGALFAGMALYTGFDWSLLPLCMLAFTLLCVTLCDLADQIIPDGLVIFGAAWGIAWVGLSVFLPLGAPGWQDALLGAVCAAGPIFLIDRAAMLAVKKDAFGYGDVKLLLMIGLFLGWKRGILALLFGIVLGGVAGVIVLRRRREEGGTYMAFGPYLCAGALLALWLGEPVLDFYGFL